MKNQWTSERLSLNVSETILEILIVERNPFLKVYLNLEVSSETFNWGREAEWGSVISWSNHTNPLIISGFHHRSTYCFLWFHFLVEDANPKTMLRRVVLLGVVSDVIFSILGILAGPGEETHDQIQKYGGKKFYAPEKLPSSKTYDCA